MSCLPFDCGHLHLVNVRRSMAALMELPMRMPNEDLIALCGASSPPGICPLKRCRAGTRDGPLITARLGGQRGENRQKRRRGIYKLASRQLRRHSHVCNCIKCANIFPFSSCRFLFNLTILFDFVAALFCRFFCFYSICFRLFSGASSASADCVICEADRRQKSWGWGGQDA